MRILIVDDHEVVRRGVRELLGDDFVGAEFGEAENGDQALAMAERESWDLVVLDIQLTPKSGLDVLTELHARDARLPILILSAHEEAHYATRALRAGARGYISKRSAPGELVAAARKAIAGTRSVSPAVAERVAISMTAPPLHESLSDREFQVLRMLAVGKSVKEVGTELALSEKTISTYRARLLEKLQLRSNAELIRYAIRMGLVE